MRRGRRVLVGVALGGVLMLSGCAIPTWALTGGLGFVFGQLTGGSFAITQTTTRCFQNGEQVPCPEEIGAAEQL